MKVTPYSFPYPVADTESGPTIEWKEFNLTLSFTDYLNEDRRIIFEEVSHFEFLSEDAAVARQFQYDGVVEIKESERIKELVRIGEISEAETNDFHHIAIGFNEIGSYLSIVFRNIQTKQTEQGGAGQRR